MTDWLLRRKYAFGHDDVSPISTGEYIRTITGLLSEFAKAIATGSMDGVWQLILEK